MFLHRSNRAEVLLGELANLVAVPLGGPLASECIVVQGKGMERWVAMGLARQHGVWANPDFPFARAVIDRAFAALLGDQAPEPWDASGLRWAVAQCLVRMQDDPGFEVIHGYLAGDRDHRKLLQLSTRVAKVLDGYGVYRPELLQKWQKRGGDDWQAKLWQTLHTNYALQPIADLETAFMQALASASGAIPGFPERISLFGISALPPLYLRIFAALATRIEVHLFVLSPSQEYWADIRSQREILRQDLRPDGVRDLEHGNDLLASLGRLHRDFHTLLERDVNYIERSENYSVPAHTGTILGQVQSDVLHLRQPEGNAQRRVIVDGDHSLSIHSCHSPIRELEVLRDQIWARLHADPSLEARDIIVMCPNIEEYAPFIDAVFAERSGGDPVLPFHIADRSAQTTSVIIDGFLRVLALAPGRLPGPAVLDLLATQAIRERFEIDASEIATVREWIAKSHIRWARDADHREAVGQPASDLNTWRFGLRRLLLGYASPAVDLELFAGTLAYDDIEGSIADLLGRFAEFCESLFAVQKDLQGRHSLASWHVRLERSLRAMLVSSDETAGQHQLLRETFAKLAEQAARFDFAGELSLASVTALVSESLDALGTSSNFLSGGIAFCQLVPMRSIPHRVICLAGMNDGAFPRNSQALSFDLVAKHPKLGDRSPRDDDRYLFLEALLAARDACIISYTGQSNQNNQVLPPSVLVGELLDYLDTSFVSVDGRAAREALVLRHPLQSFSPRYFDGQSDALFSYSSLYGQDAQSLTDATPSQSAAFINAPLHCAEADSKLVALDDLLLYYKDPARYLVNQRVGIRLLSDEEPLQPREPMELAGLAKWEVGDKLLHALRTTGNAGRASEALAAGGFLPLGTPAFIHLDREMPVVQSIVDQASAYQTGGRLANIEVNLHIGDIRLVGQLDSLWSQCRQEVTYSRPEGPRELLAWIQHLVLCHQTPADYPRETLCIGRDKQAASVIRFRPVADTGPLLHELLRIYQLGQTQPLPLFPKSSRAYAKHRRAALSKDPEAPEEASLETASNSYSGLGSSKGPSAERLDPYIALLFADSDPLRSTGTDQGDGSTPSVPSFSALAMKVFAPLLDHREKA